MTKPEYTNQVAACALAWVDAIAFMVGIAGCSWAMAAV